LELRALPGGYAPVLRLRRALKALRRSYSLQCVKAEELTADGVAMTLDPQPDEEPAQSRRFL
jgi:hypothetical protein